MKFKMKLLAIAMALAAGAAQASLSNGASGSSSMLLTLYNSTAGTGNASAAFDLGFSMDDFLAVRDLNLNPGTITWDLSAGTITESAGVSLALPVGTNDWLAALSSINSASAAGGTTSFSVLATDGSGSTATAGSRRVLTTADSATGVTPRTNLNVNSVGGGMDTYFNAVNTSGTNPTAANGAVFSTSGANYFGSNNGGANGTTLKSNFFKVNNDVSLTSNFYSFANSSAIPSAAATANAFTGTFSYDAAANQLVYSGLIAAVPEPESYAMLLAGLGMLGLIARRRIS